jgi:hypothetical protein
MTGKWNALATSEGDHAWPPPVIAPPDITGNGDAAPAIMPGVAPALGEAVGLAGVGVDVGATVGDGVGVGTLVAVTTAKMYVSPATRLNAGVNVCAGKVIVVPDAVTGPASLFQPFPAFAVSKTAT